MLLGYGCGRRICYDSTCDREFQDCAIEALETCFSFEDRSLSHRIDCMEREQVVCANQMRKCAALTSFDCALLEVGGDD